MKEYIRFKKKQIIYKNRTFETEFTEINCDH